MKKTTEISPGLLLHTLDRLAQNRAVTAIEYELEVRKNKLVIFEIDFTGSINLELEGGGGSSLRQKTVVEPGKRTIVAVVRVLDPTKSWSLETKYTWVEENPGTVQPGQSKREKLAEGLILTTSRASSPDTFSFHVLNERNVAVSLTLDCSKSVNLSMVTLDEPGSTSRKDLSNVGMNVISIVLPAYARAHVCSLVVKDPTNGYQLKTKWSWAEGSISGGSYPSSSMRSTTATTTYNPSSSMYEPSAISPAAPRSWAVDSPNLPSSSSFGTSSSFANDSTFSKLGHKPTQASSSSALTTIPMTPEHTSSSTRDSYSSSMASNSRAIVGAARPPPSSSLGAHRPRLKREEISPSVYLETEILDALPRGAEVLYTIQVAKPTRVTFEADFTGSSNLSLVPSGGLICEASVEPMSKMQVARLRAVDPSIGWKLVCRYKWQEEDIIPIEQQQRSAIVPYDHHHQPAMAFIQNAPTTTTAAAHRHAVSQSSSEVRALLRSVNLEAYAEFFEAEELTLELLRLMARDEGEFRRSLEALGVNKMGHRERILVAVKNLPVEG